MPLFVGIVLVLEGTVLVTSCQFFHSSLFAQKFRHNTSKSNKNRAGRKWRFNTDIRPSSAFFYVNYFILRIATAVML